MKKLAMSSLLAVSSCFALVGFTQANAATEPQASSSAQMQDKDCKHKHKHKHKHKRGKYGRHARGGMGFDRGPLSELGLTETQKQKIEAIRQEARDSRKNSTGRPTRAERKQHFEQVRAKIDKVLTAKQRAQLEQMKAEHQSQHEGRHGGRN